MEQSARSSGKYLLAGQKNSATLKFLREPQFKVLETHHVAQYQKDGHRKRIPFEVVAFPHYDPKKERARGIAG